MPPAEGAPPGLPGRTASGAPFVGALEGLRGVVALAVVVYHAWIFARTPPLDGGPLRAIVSTGFVGVTGFFVLSGFVLALPVVLNGGLPDGRIYLRRRTLRLVPAYLVVLAATVAVIPLAASSPDRAWDTVNPGSLLAHVTLLAGVARVLPGYEGALGFTVNPVVWTVSVEVVFSVALLAIAGVLTRRPAATLAALLLASVTARLAIPEFGLDALDRESLLSMVPALLGDFALGVAAAVLYVRRRGRPWRAAGPAATLALATLLAAMAVTGGADPGDAKRAVTHSVTASLVVSGAFAALILALASGPSVLGSLLASRPARASGRWSYGVYLVHFPILGLLVFGLEVERSMPVLLTTAVPLSLLAGAALHVTVERPTRSWARRRVPSPHATRA